MIEAHNKIHKIFDEKHNQIKILACILSLLNSRFESDLDLILILCKS